MTLEYDVNVMRDWLLDQEAGGANVFLDGCSEKKRTLAREKRSKNEEERTRARESKKAPTKEPMNVKALLKGMKKRKAA